MKEHLFTKMTKEKALWKQFFVDFEGSHQTDVAGKAFRDALRDGFKMIWDKENRSDPGQRLAQFLENITSRSFMPLHDSHSEFDELMAALARKAGNGGDIPKDEDGIVRFAVGERRDFPAPAAGHASARRG